MTKHLKQIQTLLKKLSLNSNSNTTNFFKTGPGDYAEHDQFIGVPVPTLRSIAKDFSALSIAEIQSLLASKINEERLLALIILVAQYQKSDTQLQETIYQFYIQNLKYVNNWNLVDASAHLIIGAHLQDKNKNLLLTFAKSEIMWERRIAIVSTWALIRKNDLKWTFKISSILLNDNHDLIHKAVGWMLREAGKRDITQLKAYLDQYAKQMPRTMLRYSIEKLSASERKKYLIKC